MVITRSRKALRAGEISCTTARPVNESSNPRPTQQVSTRYTLLINGKPVTIVQGDVFQVYLRGYQGLIAVEKQRLDHGDCHMKVKFYVQPQQCGLESSKYGEDELLCFNHFLQLTSQQFRQCYQASYINTKTGRNSGTSAFTMKDLDLVYKDDMEYVRLTGTEQKMEKGHSRSVMLEQSFKEVSISETTRNECTGRSSQYQRKPIILSYDDYCTFRKWKKSMQSGSILVNSDVIAKKLVFEQPTAIFFAREMFNLKSMKVDTDEEYHFGRRIQNNEKRAFDYTQQDMDAIDDRMFKKFKNAQTTSQEEGYNRK